MSVFASKCAGLQGRPVSEQNVDQRFRVPLDVSLGAARHQPQHRAPTGLRLRRAPTASRVGVRPSLEQRAGHVDDIVRKVPSNWVSRYVVKKRRSVEVTFVGRLHRSRSGTHEVRSLFQQRPQLLYISGIHRMECFFEERMICFHMVPTSPSLHCL